MAVFSQKVWYNGWLMENMDKGADKSAKNTPNIYQAQKFGILMEKGFIGRP